MTGFPMWLAAMFALEVAGTLDVSDSGRAYVREAITGEGAALDLENVPSATLTLDWPTTTLAIEYAPRLFWSDVGGPEASPTLLLHNGGVWLGASDERLSVGLAQTFAYGDQSFARLSFERGPLERGPDPAAPAAPSPELDLIPGPTVVRIAATETSASLRYAWSRTVSTELRPSFGITGGADRTAQRVLPRQRTARVEGLVDVEVSQRDTLTTTAAVMQSSISNGYDHVLVSVMETWSRRLAIESGAALGAGVAVQETYPPVGPSDAEWQPVGVARIWHALLARSVQVRLRGELGYQPHINALTGTLQRRVYASADATTTHDDTSVRLALGAAQTLPPDQIDAAQSLSADLVLEQALLDWLSAELGGQLIWQSLGGDSSLVLGDPLWMVFAGAQGRLPSVRF